MKKKSPEPTVKYHRFLTFFCHPPPVDPDLHGAVGVHDGRLRLGRGRRRGRGRGREGVLAPHTGRLGRLAVVDSPAVKPEEEHDLVP